VILILSNNLASEQQKSAASLLSLADLLDLPPPKPEEEPILAEYLCGNKVLPSSRPWAQAYAGFQFGLFAGA
jgi:uncharacterized protein YdiU (UPF0061 family)